MPEPQLRPDPAYLEAFATIMSRIGDSVGPRGSQPPVTVAVAGGAAFHFYTGARISRDIDARVLARARLVDAGALRKRADEALPDYVGNLERIRTSINLACRMVAKERAKG